VRRHALSGTFGVGWVKMIGVDGVLGS
jgi:hypothetical protein